MAPLSAARIWAIVALIVLAHAPTVLAQSHVASRPMEIEDLFRRERVVDVVPSPDGSQIAVVVRRAATAKERYQQGSITEGRSDVWLIDANGAHKRNLTNGVTEAAGYWLPAWAPDGQHLAMASTKGGDGVHAYVWSRRGDSLKRLSDSDLDIFASSEPSGSDWNNHPFAWVSATELAFLVMPPGGQSSFANTRTASTHAAMAAWPKAERGLEPTVSVLETGPDVEQSIRSGRLLLANVASGSSRVLANIPMEEGSSGQRYFVLSPSHRHAVVLTSARRKVDATRGRLTRSESRNRIGIVSLDGTQPGVRWVDSLSAVVSQQFEHMIRWSPNDTSLAILARRASDLDGPSRVYTISAADGAVHRLVPDEWETAVPTIGREILVERANVVWTQAGRPIVYARGPGKSSDATHSTRFDWWSIGADGAPHNVTAAMTEVPATLSRTPDPGAFVGLAGGRLWRLDVETGVATQIARGLPRVKAIAWPSRRNLPVATLDRFVVDVGTDRQPELYEVSIGAADATRHITIPAFASNLVDYVPSQSLALFSNGDRVMAARTAGASELLVLNANLPQIEPPAQRLISYRGIDGDTLSAVVVLPNGYVPGKRYPLIAWVYAGWVFHDTLSLDDPYNGDALLYAAHGYAVLVPSMPLKPTTMPSDPYNDIPKGVMPAVDRVIDLGIADPARLGVTGTSYGGYSTYTLISTTTRFRAAVAEVGPADLIATYGSFRATERYGDQPHLALANAKMAEGGQLRMGTSPWGDLWRYLKNSPFYYLDRVATPVLIVAGDQDIVEMGEVEGVFTALHRLGKHAALARYWGEWHGFDSPANIRDLWQRKLAWFDRFLCGKPKCEDAAR